MATPAHQRVGMPLDEFLELGNRNPFELINGERKPKLPNAAEHSELLLLLFKLLDGYVVANQLGKVYIETTFILPNRSDPNWVKDSRIPDMMFYAGTRIADYKAATPNWKKRPFAIVPDLVIEVLSPNDKPNDVSTKADLYLQDGVRLIWSFDPQQRTVAIREPDQEAPVTLKEGDTLDAGDLLPNFKALLSEIFAD